MLSTLNPNLYIATHGNLKLLLETKTNADNFILCYGPKMAK